MQKSLTPIAPPAGILADPLVLPDNLFWTNELDYTPVAQTAIRALDGTLHTHTLTRKGGGRPIDLEGADRARIRRSDLRILQAWAAIPAQKMTLWIGGNSYKVIFDHGVDDDPAVTSEPVFAYSDITDNEWHTNITLRFLTIE